MRRGKSLHNLYNKKHSSFELGGVWLDVLGNPETSGAWLIWGNEKNGKTWLTLLLSDMLSSLKKVLYISGEEGTGKDFIASCVRAKISPANKSLQLEDYMTIEEIAERLNMRKAPGIVIVDNITVYADELKNGGLRRLLLMFPKTLFIFLAHEDRGEPYTATAKLCRRLAKIIIYVEGLACIVSGRCPGGRLVIDEQKAALYHGQQALAQ